MYNEKQKKLIYSELMRLVVKFESGANASKEIGVSTAGFSRWLNGNLKIDIKHLKKLKILGCNIRKLRPDLKDFLI